MAISRFRHLAAYLAAGLGGLVAGGLSAAAIAGLVPGVASLSGGSVDIDGWKSDFAIGSAAADPYTRARVARHGLLALARSEAVYFTRDTDSNGRPLTEACAYRLSGGAMPARWWSVTLYDGESRLPMNGDGRLSIDASRAGSGRWSAIIAPTAPQDDLWLSSRNAGHFDLTLRLYEPEERLFANPDDVLTPPRIERESCEGDAR